MPDGRRALPWGEVISKQFQEGDCCGVMGQSMPVGGSKAMKAEDKKLPVVILTGFLGAGKTTLLNYILEEQREKKIAVIENEFGEIQIDGELINQKFDLAEQVVVMDNGCMCCQVRGDLVAALAEIQKKLANGNHLDMILVETTGMADPVPIAKTFKENPWVTEIMRYDGCITVVDAKNCITRLDLPVEEGAVNEAEKQITFADKVILNKIDLCDYDQCVAVKDRILDYNKFVRILPAVKGKVKIEELMNLQANNMSLFDTDGVLDEKPEVSKEEFAHGHGHGDAHGHGHDDDCDEPSHGHGHGSEHGHGHGGHGHDEHECSDEDCDQVHHDHGHQKKKSRHDSRVNSIGVQEYGEMTQQSLSGLMRALSQVPEGKGLIMRIKAIFAVQGIRDKVAFHAVMDCTDEEMIGPWKEGEKRVCKLVVIGRSIDKAYIRDAFNTAVVIKSEHGHGHGHGHGR
jgi:G3E family GTPase